MHTDHEPAASRGNILVVDDDEMLARMCARVLERNDFSVATEHDATEATRRLRTESFDLIISDINLPGLNGIGLLRSIREFDFDLPVVLMSGEPTMDTAIAAVDLGALRYLTKPFEAAALVETAAYGVQVRRLAEIKRDAYRLHRAEMQRVHNEANLRERFELAVDQLYLIYQPIIKWSARKTWGYEAFMRSEHPDFPNPLVLLEAAERLDCMNLLSRAVQARAAALLPSLSTEHLLFVNLHPTDLNDEQLYEESAPMNELAQRIVLEITERASLQEVPDMPSKLDLLRQLGFKIAVDDLGSGYAGLETFVRLEPHIVKADMSLVRGVHADPRRQRIIRAMVEISEALEIELVCEGVETAEERDELSNLGCDLMQGYFFAKPDREPPQPTF